MPGVVRGATDVDQVDAVPTPTLLIALTRKMYCVPFVNPVIEADVALDVPSAKIVQEVPLFVEYSMR